MQINVTQEHIDKGCKAEANNCPIAHALQEATGLHATVFSTISLYNSPERTNDDKVFEQKTPRIAKQFIHDYDQDKPVEPFTFEIDYENQSNPESH